MALNSALYLEQLDRNVYTTPQILRVSLYSDKNRTLYFAVKAQLTLRTIAVVNLPPIAIIAPLSISRRSKNVGQDNFSANVGTESGS